MNVVTYKMYLLRGERSLRIHRNDALEHKFVDKAIQDGYTPLGRVEIRWRSLNATDIVGRHGGTWLLPGDWEVLCTIEVKESIWALTERFKS